MDVERIKFERIGGFTGMRTATDIEKGDLSEEQARAVGNTAVWLRTV